MHVSDKWNSDSDQYKIVAKFGFQQTNSFDKEHTRGFIFGNVTSLNQPAGRAALFIVPQTLISNFFSDSMYGQTCDSLLHNISRVAFEAKCFQKGTSDVLRRIPCAKGKLCQEEDDPAKVVSGFQMTMKVEEPVTPQYWYVVLVRCTLNDNCSWISSGKNVEISYDLWLTNGSPSAEHIDLFAYQFSFDEQDSVIIYSLSLAMYIVLSIFEWRAVAVRKQDQISGKQKLLCLILFTKTLGLFLQSLNVIVFAYDGRGLVVARFLGEFFRLGSICILYLLLILLSRGWSINDYSCCSCNRTAILAWIVIVLLHYFFFFANFFFVVDLLHDIDVFKSWPGYGMLLVRMCQALWFLTEIRYTISRENSEEKAVFIAYFGAGFLVWFVYLSALGVIVSYVSVLWRFKVILTITTFANFVAISSLVHLFWPTGSYSRFFISQTNPHRRLDSVNSAEIRDIEYLLQDSDSDSEHHITLDLHAI